MKKLFLIAVVSILTVFASACSGGNEASGDSEKTEGSNEQQYELRISHVVNEDTPIHKALEEFKKEVEQNSEGRIKVEFFPNGQLYASERESIEAVQQGNIEMAVVATSPAANFSKSLTVLDLPFLFDSAETAYEALDGELGQKLLDDLAEQGLRGFSFGETGMRQMTNNNGPIESIDDMKGLKIRTMENQVHIKTFNALGANASSYAVGELYNALQQNIYNAQENPPNIIETMNFHEVQDYLTITNHAYTANFILMDNNLFDQMPEDLQQIIEEAAKEWSTKERALAQEEDKKALEVISETMEVNELSPEQRQVFIDATKPIYEEYKNEIGTELVELAESYRN